MYQVWWGQIWNIRIHNNSKGRGMVGQSQTFTIATTMYWGPTYVPRTLVKSLFPLSQFILTAALKFRRSHLHKGVNWDRCKDVKQSSQRHSASTKSSERQCYKLDPNFLFPKPAHSLSTTPCHLPHCTLSSCNSNCGPQASRIGLPGNLLEIQNLWLQPRSTEEESAI